MEWYDNNFLQVAYNNYVAISKHEVTNGNANADLLRSQESETQKPSSKTQNESI